MVHRPFAVLALGTLVLFGCKNRNQLAAEDATKNAGGQTPGLKLPSRGSSMPTDLLLARAQEAGPLPPGSYRVVVLESDLRLSARDFQALEDARRYADDVASESEDEPAIAKVFDERFECVHEGRSFAQGGTSAGH